MTDVASFARSGLQVLPCAAYRKPQKTDIDSWVRDILMPVISIHVWSNYFSHSAYEKGEAKMVEIDVQCYTCDGRKKFSYNFLQLKTIFPTVRISLIKL